MTWSRFPQRRSRCNPQSSCVSHGFVQAPLTHRMSRCQQKSHGEALKSQSGYAGLFLWPAHLSEFLLTGSSLDNLAFWTPTKAKQQHIGMISTAMNTSVSIKGALTP